MAHSRASNAGHSRPVRSGGQWRLLLGVLLLGASLWTPLQAQPEAEPAAAPAAPAKAPAGEKKLAAVPLARYVAVNSPVDDNVFRHVRNTALGLQELAAHENRPAFLFLEIRPGQSEFHQVLGLAQFLSSARVDRLTTVAWVPETITGNNAIVAFGCKEIVMQPDAQLGDLGRGRAVDVTEEQSILALVDKRHNPRLNHDLALGMMNPEVSLLQVTLDRDGVAETRVVTEQQAKVLRDNQIPIRDAQVIKDARKPGLFSGQQARELGVLVTHTANMQAELAEIYRLDPQSLKEYRAGGESTLVRMIDVTEVIDPVLETFLERQIDRSLQEGAQTLIFRITSPGGYLMSGMNLAQKIADLEQKKIRTVAWIPHQALSSAAIAALGCDEIYIGPTGQIGDAGVIQRGADGAFDRVPEKLISPLIQKYQELAKKKHRPHAVLKAMTLKDLEVFQVRHRESGRTWFMSEEELANSNEWEKGALVPESAKGLLLTLQGERAVELKIAAGVASDLDMLKDRLNIPPDVQLVGVARTWVDSLVFFLNNSFVTGFLFFIAIVLIYIELHFMIGIFGIGSALCFGIFFWSRYFGGTATGLEIILFLLGVVCILLEVLVIPGFGVFGITGGLLVLSSLVLASENFTHLEPDVNSQKLVQALTVIGLPLLGVMVTSMLVGKYLPSIPLLRGIVLTPPSRKHAGDTDTLQLRPDLVETPGRSLAVGQIGTTVTTLRPSGKARFGEHLVDVVSQGPFIEPQKPVEVLEIRGNRIVVDEVS